MFLARWVEILVRQGLLLGCLSTKVLLEQQVNYLNSLRSVGFGDDDFGSESTPASDRIVDAIVAWGDEDAIVKRIREHEAAGADHVAIQVLTPTPRTMPHAEWRRLADALGL